MVLLVAPGSVDEVLGRGRAAFRIGEVTEGPGVRLM
jgi:hypothetical protein